MASPNSSRTSGEENDHDDHHPLSDDEQQQQPDVSGELEENQSSSDDDDKAHDDSDHFIIKPVVRDPETPAAKGPTKGTPFTRIWSREDEIVLLEGIIDYKQETNKDPSADHERFRKFVAPRLSNPEYTKIQVMEKVRGLKNKYKKNLSKSSDGGDATSFRLSQQIWGALLSGVNLNGGGVSKGVKKARKPSHVDEDEDDDESMEDAKRVKIGYEKGVKEGKIRGDFAKVYPHLMAAFEEGVDVGNNYAPQKAPIFSCLYDYLTVVDPSELKEWDNKLKEVRIAEFEAVTKRNDLVHQYNTKLFAAMKSSN